MKTLLILAISLLIGVVASNDLSDKNVVILGDSITYLGKDDCTGAKGWTTYWKEITRPKSVRSYARSGASWCNTPQTKPNTVEHIGVLGPDNNIFNQIERLEEAIAKGEQPKPDLIMIAAGTNDLWYTSYFPNAFDVSPEDAMSAPDQKVIEQGPTAATSISTAMKLAFARFARICPDAQIIILTPLQATKIKTPILERGSKVIEECARLAGAKVIRQDREMPVDSAAERRSLNLTYDGVHPNEAGARANGQALATRTLELVAR